MPARNLPNLCSPRCSTVRSSTERRPSLANASLGLTFHSGRHTVTALAGTGEVTLKLRASAFALVGLSLLLAPGPALGRAYALETGRVYRIGYLNPAGASLAPLRLEPLREGLRELGYVEGRNLVIEARWGEGNFQRLSELAAELVRMKMDVMWTRS